MLLDEALLIVLDILEQLLPLVLFFLPFFDIEVALLLLEPLQHSFVFVDDLPMVSRSLIVVQGLLLADPARVRLGEEPGSRRHRLEPLQVPLF